jgi:uncharacterized protein DUF6265
MNRCETIAAKIVPRRFAAVALTLAVICACDASAQSQAERPAHVAQAVPRALPQARPAATGRTLNKAPEGGPLAPLAWLEGCWHGTAGPREFDEHWLPPHGNVMVGASQTIAQGKTQTYEYLRLEARADGVYYVVMPSKEKEVALRLAEQKADRSEGRTDELFVFVDADPTHDFPQKITYRRASLGWLYATLDGKVGGQARQLIYPLRRVGCESGELILR